LKTLKERGYITYYEWKKVRGEWKYAKTKKFPQPIFKAYLTKYYEKSLGREK